MFHTNLKIDVAMQLASVADAKIIAELAQQTYIETYGAVGNYKSDNVAKVKKVYGETFVNETLPRIIQHHIVAVAKVNQQIIGYAILLCKENNTAFLDKLYLLKSHQGQKLGTQLLQFCFKEAYEKGMSQGKLLVSKTARKKVTGFYEKFGFKKTDTQENLYTLDGKKTRTTNNVMICENFNKIFSPDPFLRKQGIKRKSDVELKGNALKKTKNQTIQLPVPTPTNDTLIKLSLFNQPVDQSSTLSLSSQMITPNNH